jgi:hypothetical protein
VIPVEVVPNEAAGDTAIEAELYSPLVLSSANSRAQFENTYQFFVVWTMPSEGVPFILGAPTSDRYPDSMNRRPVSRPTSPEALGRALRAFLDELMRYLQAGTLYPKR